MRKPLRVLMVEDSEDDALLMIRELKKGGYEPEYERVETAEAMRAALREKTWDVILCDYQLPQFNGLAAIALLKETGIDIPLIIVSGAIGEETAVECMRLGARDYVMKGNLSRLVPAIERELKEAESRVQRKKAEDALQESETRFREMFDDAPIGYHELDTEGRITRVNRTELATLGYSAEEMLGRHVWEFVDEKEHFPKSRVGQARRNFAAGAKSRANLLQERRNKNTGAHPGSAPSGQRWQNHRDSQHLAGHHRPKEGGEGSSANPRQTQKGVWHDHSGHGVCRGGKRSLYRRPPTPIRGSCLYHRH